MKVILIKDMPGLGDRYDVVNVKSGYARNYLIPKGFAHIATPSARKMLEENMKQQVHKEENIRNDAQETADKLQKLEIIIKVKTSEKGKLFGSVNNTRVTDEINKNGFELDRRRVTLSGAIKELGYYTAKIKLYRDIFAEVNFEVVSITPVKKEKTEKKAKKKEEAPAPPPAGDTGEAETEVKG